MMNNHKAGGCAMMDMMAAEILAKKAKAPSKEIEWFESKFDLEHPTEENPLCCILTFLFYYGYCKECTTPMSEQARLLLKPLMELPKEEA